MAGRFSLKFFTFTMVWCVVTLQMGCCKTAKDKAVEAEKKAATLQMKYAGLKLKVEELEPYKGKYNACKRELETAKQNTEKLTLLEAQNEERHKTIKRLLDRLKGVIEAGDLAVRIRQNRMVLTLPSAVLFQSGKADLSDKGKNTLVSVAEVLKDIKNRSFQIAGHTDKDPVGEDNPYKTNWHLSSARAIEVLRYLKEKGISARKMSAAGYAHFQPVGSNKTEKGKARNRRIEITLMPNLAELPDLSRLEKKLGLTEETKE